MRLCPTFTCILAVPLQRLFAQIERILHINNLRTITGEVVQTAREHLLIGEA